MSINTMSYISYFQARITVDAETVVVVSSYGDENVASILAESATSSSVPVASVSNIQAVVDAEQDVKPSELDRFLHITQ